MKRKLHILHLEDDSADFELIRSTLELEQVECSLEHVQTRDNYIAALDRGGFELVLSDFSMPAFDGFSALKLAIQKCPEVPFIFVSGAMGEEVAIEMLKEGATDYVLKNKLSRLPSAITRALREAEERFERKRAERDLRDSNEQLRMLAAHLQSIREEERTKIAREIHDEFGQILTVIKMDISLLKDICDGCKRLNGRHDSMIKLIDTTIKSVKRLCTELRPGILDNLGLSAAIEWQAEEFQKRTAIECEVSFNQEEIILDGPLSTAIFRIFQEALTNIARHSGASKVKINLDMEDSKIVLSVTDNGKGILEQDISKSQSFGLIGMMERARSFGGKVTISGCPCEGTTLTVDIPIIKSEGS